MKRYQIPIVVVVEANSYEEAFDNVRRNIRATYTDDHSRVNMFFPYLEHDEAGQRVIYLHPENDPDPDQR